MTPPLPIRVYLLDDHEIVRQGMRTLLEAAGDIEVVGESGSAEEAAARIPVLCPDVAVLDNRLPDGSGVEVCRHVRAVDPSIRALVLTSYDDDEALFAAIMAGASGYLLKEIKGSDVVSAIRQVAAGRSLIDPSLLTRVLDRVRNGPAVADELAVLTEQELKLLTLITEGLTNRQISEQMCLAEKTVKNYVSHSSPSWDWRPAPRPPCSPPSCSRRNRRRGTVLTEDHQRPRGTIRPGDPARQARAGSTITARGVATAATHKHVNVEGVAVGVSDLGAFFDRLLALGFPHGVRRDGREAPPVFGPADRR